MPDVQQDAYVPSPPPQAREAGGTRRKSPDDHWLEDELRLAAYIDLFRRRWILVLLGAVLGALAGAAVGLTRPVLFEGVTTVVVLPPARPEAPPVPLSAFRGVFQNNTVAAAVIQEAGLDQPPHSLTPQSLVTEALQIEEVPGTNFIKVRVRLLDPMLAAEASHGLAQKAVELAHQMGEQGTSALRDQMKSHLNGATERLKTAERQLLAYRQKAQLDVLRKDVESALAERSELLQLMIDIAAEKARIDAASREIETQPRILATQRSVATEEALRQAAGLDATSGSGMLDLSNPILNPVHETLAFQIATGRARLAALEQQRREIVEVRKLGRGEMKQLSELYAHQLELARLETNYDVAKRVYSDLSLRYEQVSIDALGRTPMLQIIDPAVAPDRAQSRQVDRMMLLGIAVGLLAGALAAIIIENLKPRRTDPSVT